MLLDTAEQEEAFFRYENNFLVRQSGYYIYYEKNIQMQNYMHDGIAGNKDKLPAIFFEYAGGAALAPAVKSM